MKMKSEERIKAEKEMEEAELAYVNAKEKYFNLVDREYEQKQTEKYSQKQSNEQRYHEQHNNEPPTNPKEIIQQLYNKFESIKWYNDAEGIAGKAGYEWCIRDLMQILGVK